MTSKWKCPFCGQPGKPTQEHVWPKWLRKSPAAQSLMSQTHGERTPYEYSDLLIEGSRVVEAPRSVNVHRWVPNITTPVCGACNNGWMSRLESTVRRAIGPFVLRGETMTVEGSGVQDLARWAVKTAMAYLMALRMSQGVFTPDEIRQLAKKQTIPERCRVWVRCVSGAHQIVACQYRGLVFPDADDVHGLSLRDSLGVFQIGLVGMVVVVGVAPDKDSRWMVDALLPLEYGTALAPRIWPKPGRLQLPTKGAEDDFDPAAVFEGISTLGDPEARGLTELTSDELAEALAARPRPAHFVSTLVDRLASVSQSKRLDENELEAVLLLDPKVLTVEQLQTLMNGALDLMGTHGESSPIPVARYLYNLGHLMRRAGTPQTSVVLFTLAVGQPEAEYSGRPDAWEALGNVSWQVGAFHAAGDAYARQLALAPDDRLALFNLAESRFWEGDLESAAKVFEGVTFDGQEAEVLRDNAALLQATLKRLRTRGPLFTIEGFSGPEPLEMIQSLASGLWEHIDQRGEFAAAVLKHLDSESVSDGGLRAIRAYLTDRLDDWVEAACSLLLTGAEPHLLHPVLRKGKSLDQTFAALLHQALTVRDATVTPELYKVLGYVEAHSYASHQTIKRLVDECNRIVEEM